MSEEEYKEKSEDDNFPMWDWESKISHDLRTCRDCHNDLIKEQIRIEWHRRSDEFKKMSTTQKGFMVAAGELPANMCHFCAARMPDGPYYNWKYIYCCDKCHAEGRRVGDIDRESRSKK